MLEGITTWKVPAQGRHEMNSPATLTVLGQSSLFRQLDADALEALAARGVRRRFRPRQPIFFAGDPGDAVYVVAAGAVRLSFASAQGEEVLIDVVRPPGSFGELAAVDGGHRSTCAEAVEDTELLAVPRSVLAELMKTEPAVANAVALTLAATLRRVTTRMTDLALLDVPGRLAKLILALADAKTGSATPGAAVELRMTQTDIARAIGASRQAVNSVLSGFERRGVISRVGQTLVVHKPDELRRRAAVVS